MNWDDLTEEQKDAIIEATANAVGGAYDCMRVWSAWSYGTMSENDFLPVTDSNERLVDIASAVVESLPSPATEMVPWEPRDGWPTMEQVQAWNGDGLSWRCAGGTVTVTSDSGGIRAATSDGVIHSQVWPLGLRGLVPFRDGRPVSWSEVDAAVEAMTVSNNNGENTHG